MTVFCALQILLLTYLLTYFTYLGVIATASHADTALQCIRPTLQSVLAQLVSYQKPRQKRQEAASWPSRWWRSGQRQRTRRRYQKLSVKRRQRIGCWTTPPGRRWVPPPSRSTSGRDAVGAGLPRCAAGRTSRPRRTPCCCCCGCDLQRWKARLRAVLEPVAHRH